MKLRRNKIYLYSPAEKAILDAMDEVEMLGADPRLTDAVDLLGAAKIKVADYIDEQPDSSENDKDHE